MHELGIAEQILEIVAERSGGSRVTRVVLEVGALTAVLPDALRFCFDVASRDTVAEGARLDIVEQAARARCRACGAETEIVEPWGLCACGGADLHWLAGRELRIREMEVA